MDVNIYTRPRYFRSRNFRNYRLNSFKNIQSQYPKNLIFLGFFSSLLLHKLAIFGNFVGPNVRKLRGKGVYTRMKFVVYKYSSAPQKLLFRRFLFLV